MMRGLGLSKIISDSCGLPLSGAAETMACNLIARLEHFYPSVTPILPEGAWRVAVNEQGGTIEVTNMMLAGRWGFLMHINKIDPEGRKVVRAGGELLERYRISRARTQGLRIEQMAAAPRNFRGDMVPDAG